MELWARHGCGWNFEHKFELLNAEYCYCNGNLEDAKTSYKNAILKSQESKFLNDEALAYELAAKFYLETGDRQASQNHFRLAHKKYIEWGAVSKADHLLAFANENFDNFLPS